ncbi:hypothetical protein HBH92_108640 [Parastagonospora nodorum]|nr:hypothetical protein HBH92_108640 [Parastagonospora nodorum]KAH4438964.1 hypothetical protein HBH93_094190 [Parastagonospora nodorum]KAH4445172.1 hypothetical protein HBH91_151840 [Parastagonospora nodorum]KAH4491754.1 hypothetical protein HBH89_171810 [Parastagonospora nodorum]KAH4545944.1 hypothetical protein HBH85_076830 [Parastagonospora nodorum]
MAILDVPNWVRILLLITSAISFIPQLLRTISRKNSTGISSFYVLFNLISTTEQFALTFFFIMNYPKDSDFFVHNPKNAGDWINFAQMSVIVVLWLTYFVVCLYLPSDHRDCSVKIAIGTYITFLLVSVIPVFSDAAFASRGPDRRMEMDIFFGVHSQFLSWIITSFNVVAVYFQLKETRLRPQERALSGLGLAVQAVIFTVVAFSWVGRIKFPYPDGEIPWTFLSTWYQLVGWATVNNGIFALGQAILLWIIAGHRLDEQVYGETEPLLRA